MISQPLLVGRPRDRSGWKGGGSKCRRPVSWRHFNFNFVCLRAFVTVGVCLKHQVGKREVSSVHQFRACLFPAFPLVSFGRGMRGGSLVKI